MVVPVAVRIASREDLPSRPMVTRDSTYETRLRRDGLVAVHQTYRWLHCTQDLHDHLTLQGGSNGVLCAASKPTN